MEDGVRRSVEILIVGDNPTQVGQLQHLLDQHKPPDVRHVLRLLDDTPTMGAQPR